MTLSLVWKDLTLQQVETVTALLDNKQKADKFLSETFNLDLDDEGSDAIIIDYYYYNLVFAEECGFTAEKISTFFSIMKNTLFKACENRNATMTDALKLFNKLLTDHSVHRPPFSVQIFSFDDVAKIADYAVNSFFQHFKLYQYVFVEKETLKLETTDIFREVEAPPQFPPMTSAIPEETILNKVFVWDEEEPTEVLREQLEMMDLSTITPEVIQKAVKAALQQQVIELKRSQRMELEEVEKQLMEKVTHPDSQPAESSTKVEEEKKEKKEEKKTKKKS
ncbi:putative flagellar associated protein [Monocercomonoides exilis]|uniref:putative flagellar associated protein n=1 Tax=Monocercomonoides exilis TaxID=2049356 RepID=UPI003559AD88|nr:putative flagellar associated protein [Monocercomonoides exilis]|eukprot:MONOS_9201.1-p1 / transcript=MONOS_9201.1 / gene=MONOS_9201 / organism=Monocercomonoides_exilis_PA203 / gene_product=flagellar associated protein / transcript_product=flagellar associated protein / location=Mono_scaffold00371:21927-23096(-) / protein_length=278 / sequence_SO=supercontig / SO=protein_coding / is_pseudo=false